jgi:hypothetical protein
VRVICHLREIRGKRGMREISEAAGDDKGGFNRGTLSMLERGRMLPKDEWVPRLEHAYGAPVTQWYPAAVLLVIQADEELD